MTPIKFCGCVDLRVGVIIISIIQTLGGLGFFIYALMDKDGMYWDVLEVYACLLRVGSGLSLLYGAIKYSLIATSINLVLSLIAIVFIILTGIMAWDQADDCTCSCRNFPLISGSAFFLVALIEVYFWVCAYSFLKTPKLDLYDEI